MSRWKFWRMFSDQITLPSWLILSVLIIYLTYSIFAPIYFNYDQKYWLGWTEQILSAGLGTAYAAEGNNYPPFLLYILFLWGKYTEVSQIPLTENFGALRAVVFLFDILTVVICAKILMRLKLSVWPALLLLLNFGWLYNSLIWRQVDSVFSFFVLASLYCLFSKKVLWATLFYVLALNTKVQSIVFLPIFLLGVLQVLQLRHSITEKVIGARAMILKVVAVAIPLQLILLLPYILSGTLSGAVNSVTQAVDYYPVISANAHNLWTAMLGIQRIAESDTQTFWYISYKHWGYLIFCAASFLALAPTLLVSLHPKAFNDREKWEVFSASATLVFGSFFLFNTQMHERYIHPAIVFCGLFALVSRKRWSYVWYIACSALYFLNLEWVNYVWSVFHTDFYFTSPQFISRAYVATFVIGFFCFYFSSFALMRSRFTARGAAR